MAGGKLDKRQMQMVTDKQAVKLIPKNLLEEHKVVCSIV